MKNIHTDARLLRVNRLQMPANNSTNNLGFFLGIPCLGYSCLFHNQHPFMIKIERNLFLPVNENIQAHVFLVHGTGGSMERCLCEKGTDMDIF